ncbi:hypothetical protein ALO82_200199 [Pseudomonas syringae pv. broussonetiae]|uniref:hypothetical protein n=1 Tax=Pseudomonas savastanoi TaxID=29438 RepID=UPI0006E4DECF|nr:hypothetical protein [Pseudomonas savastanoi]KPW62910.1 hypothetical protein ALO82_200199 [Pseudomonas syringae pv. broussonetiae]
MKIVNIDTVKELIESAKDDQTIFVVESFSTVRKTSYHLAASSLKVFLTFMAVSSLALILDTLRNVAPIFHDSHGILIISTFSFIVSSLFVLMTNRRIRHEVSLRKSFICDSVREEIELLETEYVLKNTGGTQLGMFNFHSLNPTAFLKKEEWIQYV